MKIFTIPVGDLKCNCYLIEIEGKIFIVDPGDDVDKIVKAINGRDVVGILVTHNHFDHVGCVKDLSVKYGVLVYDRYNLKEGLFNIGDIFFKVIYTFGHTMDSITYYFEEEKVMFTGDFLFSGTIGRCDFEESNYNEMIKSIDKIKKYDDDVVVYPGHGVSTTLGKEKLVNPYFIVE